MHGFGSTILLYNFYCAVHSLPVNPPKVTVEVIYVPKLTVPSPLMNGLHEAKEVVGQCCFEANPFHTRVG